MRDAGQQAPSKEQRAAWNHVVQEEALRKLYTAPENELSKIATEALNPNDKAALAANDPNRIYRTVNNRFLKFHFKEVLEAAPSQRDSLMRKFAHRIWGIEDAIDEKTFFSKVKADFELDEELKRAAGIAGAQGLPLWRAFETWRSQVDAGKTAGWREVNADVYEARFRHVAGEAKSFSEHAYSNLGGLPGMYARQLLPKPKAPLQQLPDGSLASPDEKEHTREPAALNTGNAFNVPRMEDLGEVLKHQPDGKPVYVDPKELGEARFLDKHHAKLLARHGEYRALWKKGLEPKGYEIWERNPYIDDVATWPSTDHAAKALVPIEAERKRLQQHYQTELSQLKGVAGAQDAEITKRRQEILATVKDPVEREKQLEALSSQVLSGGGHEQKVENLLIQATRHFEAGLLSAQQYNELGEVTGQGDLVTAYQEQKAEEAWLESLKPRVIPSLLGSTKSFEMGEGADPRLRPDLGEKMQRERSKAIEKPSSITYWTEDGRGPFTKHFPGMKGEEVEKMAREMVANSEPFLKKNQPTQNDRFKQRRDGGDALVLGDEHFRPSELVVKAEVDTVEGRLARVDDRMQAEIDAVDAKFRKAAEPFKLSEANLARLKFMAMSEAAYQLPIGTLEMVSSGKYMAGKTPVVGGFVIMRTMGSVAETAARVSRGETVPDEKMAELEAALIEMRRPKTWTATVVNGALDSASFAAEFYVSAGVLAGGRKLAMEGFEKLATAELRDVLANTLARQMLKRGMKVAGYTMIGGGSRVFELAHRRAHLDGVHVMREMDGKYIAAMDAGHAPGSLWEKLPGALLHQSIETGSEMIGGAGLDRIPGVRKLLDSLTGPAKNAVLKQAVFQAFVQRNGVKRAMAFLSRGSQRLEKAGVHSLHGELAEEVWAAAGHTVFEGEAFHIPSPEEASAMLATILLTRGAMTVGNAAVGGGGQQRERAVAAPRSVMNEPGQGGPPAEGLSQHPDGVSADDGVHQDQSLMSTGAKNEGPQLSFATADPAENDPVARRAIELGADPRRFRRGRPSQSKDLGQIFTDYSLKENEVVLSPNPPKNETIAQSYLVTHKAGGRAIVNVTKDGTAWVDTQEMGDVARDPATGLEIPRKEGEKPEPIKGGDLIYQAAMTYAYNNGLKFRSDPSGTTDIAKYRRISHMLSSALRHGTTRHLSPYGKKKKDNDLVANEWRNEDTPEAFEHNVGLMLRAEMEFVQRAMASTDAKADPKNHVKFEDLRYDQKSDNVLQQVKDEYGTLAGWRRISKRDFEIVVEGLVSRNSGVGPTTLSRALVTKSEVERHASGLDRGSYEEAAELHGGGGISEGTGVELFRLLGTAEKPRDLYYSRGEASGSERVQRTGVTQAETAAAEARLKSTAQGRAIYGNVLIVNNRDQLDGLQGRPDQQRYHAEDLEIMRDAEGFHDPRDGTVVIFRQNVRVLEGETAAQAMARVVVHERVGHHGFDALRASDSKFAEEWKKLAAAIPADQMKKLEASYTHLNGNREALALEWFAHQAGEMGGRAQLEPGSVTQRMWQVMRDWVTRQFNLLGNPSKPMTQELIDAHVRGLIRATQRGMVKGAKSAKGQDAGADAKALNGHGTLLGGRTQFSTPSSPDGAGSPIPPQKDDSSRTSTNIDSTILIPYVQQHGQGTKRRRDAQAALGALLARAEADAGANARADAAQRIRAESESLVSWARESGWLIEPAGFTGLIDTLEGFEGGAEHEVFGVPEKGRVLKLTRPPNFGARGVLPSYLKNIKWSNALFHDDIRMEGVIETGDGPAVVISQPYIEGHSPEHEDVQDWFKQQGYLPAGENTWRHPDTGAVIADAHTRNFIMTDANELVPIDLQVLNPGKDILEQERHEQQ
jgi:hypothetical protein